MTIDQFKQTLSIFSNNGVGAEFYFILERDGNIAVKSADIDIDAQQKLKNQFTRHIRESIVENENLHLINLSAADDRINAIYKYDLPEIPDDLSVLESILANQNVSRFSFQQDSMLDIKGILIRIGVDDHQIALYKKNYPVSLIQRESPKFFMLKRHEHRFDELDSDVLRINPKFEFMKINGTIYIVDIKALEKFFGFSEIIIKEAKKGIKKIVDSGLVENPISLEENISDISFSRKLTKVLANSPVLNLIPNIDVIEFIENHPTLYGKIKINNDRTKIVLNSKKSRQLLVKLLNDDFLTSELTNKYYESIAKDAVN